MEIGGRVEAAVIKLAGALSGAAAVSGFGLENHASVTRKTAGGFRAAMPVGTGVALGGAGDHEH